MSKVNNIIILAILLLIGAQQVSAKKQNRESIKILIFRYGAILHDANIEYKVMPGKMPAQLSGVFAVTEGNTIIDGGTMTESGFLRCHVSTTVDGITFSNFSTVGFSPDKIRTETNKPDDFEEFWKTAKQNLDMVPLNPEITLMPDLCTDLIKTYHATVNNIQGTIYRILSVPKRKGKYPALLRLPCAGIRLYYSEREQAELEMLTFYIGIHSIPVNLSDKVYNVLKTGIFKNYQKYNLDNRDNYYYKGVILGCNRSIDFIYFLSEFDGENLLVYGCNHGGALTIITSAHDNRVKNMACCYPAMCALQRYLHGRAGGWLHLFQSVITNTQNKIKTSEYYNVVNFARKLKTPGCFTWRFNDNICPPTSMYAAFNEIKSSKNLIIVPDSRHFRYPEQQETINTWM